MPRGNRVVKVGSERGGGLKGFKGEKIGVKGRRTRHES